MPERILWKKLSDVDLTRRQVTALEHLGSEASIDRRAQAEARPTGAR